MRFIFTYSRSSLFSLLFVTGIFICVSGGWQKVSAQNCPPEQPGEVNKDVTVCSLLNALRREVLPIDQRNKALVNVVQKRGIKFVQTEDEIKLFRDAGASDALIAAIGKESAKLENTSFGYIYLGKKYLDAGKRYRSMEEDFSSQARRLRQQKNEEEALKAEEEAKKNDAEAKKNLEQALTYFEQVLTLEPTNVNSLTNLGVTYEHLKRYDEALSYFSKVIDIEPSVTRYMNRAALYEKKGLATSIPAERRDAYDKANEDYGRAIVMEPCYRTAYEYRAKNYKFYGLKDKNGNDIKDKYDADLQEIEQIKAGLKTCPR